MIRSIVLGGAALATVFASPAFGETLQQALRQAYDSNPTITGARAGQRALDESVPLARANGLPSANVETDYTENVVKGANAYLAPSRSLTVSPQISVPIYAGGGVRNSIKAAKTRVEAGQANLRETEAELFTAVVGAYMDVIRDEAIVGLNAQNVHVLEVNLKATNDRFQVGDLTKTDVAQSQARLAQARSDLETAQSNLIASRENYVRLIGTPPGELEPPPALPLLPRSPEEAVQIALDDNPTLLAAQKTSDAYGYDVKAARADRLPKLSLFGSGTYFNYLGTLQGAGEVGRSPNSGKSAEAGVRLTVPLYQGGRPAAEVRQAQAYQSQAIEQATGAERQVIDDARSNFAAWQAAEQVIKSSQVAVDANRLSLQGVRAENSVGNRTILDILNAEQELLNSQVTLVSAQRDAYVAGFALLASMGHAEAKDLGLASGGLYNPLANFNRVNHKMWDWDEDPTPKPVATGTANTPTQGADVHESAVPTLDSPIDSGVPNPAVTGG
ncbi:TolC family outer membrane protein [Hephaestia mangrovi]|uniref:TolC family outer membrane protein n=1 Tax=Hephaestia mangrovi TaxID=2873268 RepID=UPI001CA79ED9|nr:TolC family outer membrane protein [Hephaestia mangrovi]MBY8827613.1 TolC family outer membrane protein [Hephaestia mangrovi]